MTDVKKIIQKAQRESKELEKLRLDKRYKDVIGRFIQEGLIEINSVNNIKKNSYKLFLEDVLWVGENLEPRVLELLPAVLIKKPSLIHKTDLPEDLNEALISLKKNNIKGAFRGILLKSCHQWIERVGRKGLLPTVTKTFRFKPEDIKRLNILKKEKQVSETEILRMALEFYSASF